MAKSSEERFRSFFTEGLPDACWLWCGGVFKDTSYGAFRLNGKVVTAHRASVILLRGIDPAGKTICHSCDNRLCVNPNHLVVASHRYNMDDMVRKGRQHRGWDRVKMALNAKRVALRKIDAATALDIYRRHKAGEPAKSIASDYGMDYTNVHKISKGDTWSHVTGAVCRRHNFQ